MAPKPWAGLGLEYFVLPDSPHLEGACRFAELASPLLPQALRVELSQPQRTGLFGDIVANADVPQAANAAH